DAFDFQILGNMCTAGPPAFGERHGHVCGIDLYVIRKPEATDDVVRVDQRPALLDLAWRDDFDRQAKIAAHRGTALKLLEPRLRFCGPQRAVLLEAGRLSRLRFERAEELACIFGKLGHVAGRPELRDETSRVPRRPTRELPALA